MDITKQLAEALSHAIWQNEHDMLLTGDEIREASKVLARYKVLQSGTYTTKECPPGFLAKVSPFLCHGCHFHKEGAQCGYPEGKCMGDEREDGESVIFIKETEKQA